MGQERGMNQDVARLRSPTGIGGRDGRMDQDYWRNAYHLYIYFSISLVFLTQEGSRNYSIHIGLGEQVFIGIGEQVIMGIGEQVIHLRWMMTRSLRGIYVQILH